MIFRDDDLCYGTFKPWEDKEVVLHPDYLWERFLMTDELFKKYNVKHTVAIICKDFDKNERMVKYIQDNPHIVPQLHCWKHVDYTKLAGSLFNDLVRARGIMKSLFGEYPALFFPPMNKANNEVHEMASSCGMLCLTNKIGLQAYINGHTNNVVNFHYWDLEVDNYLEEALKKYTRK